MFWVFGPLVDLEEVHHCLEIGFYVRFSHKVRRIVGDKNRLLLKGPAGAFEQKPAVSGVISTVKPQVSVEKSPTKKVGGYRSYPVTTLNKHYPIFYIK